MVFALLIQLIPALGLLSGECKMEIHEDEVVTYYGVMTMHGSGTFECVAEEGRFVIAFGGINFYPARRTYPIGRYGDLRVGMHVRTSDGRLASPAEEGHVRIISSRDRTVSGSFEVFVPVPDEQPVRVTGTFQAVDERETLSVPPGSNSHP